MLVTLSNHWKFGVEVAGEDEYAMPNLLYSYVSHLPQYDTPQDPSIILGAVLVLPFVSSIMDKYPARHHFEAFGCIRREWIHEQPMSPICRINHLGSFLHILVLIRRSSFLESCYRHLAQKYVTSIVSREAMLPACQLRVRYQH